MIRLAHPQINSLFEFQENRLNTLVVEASAFFRQLSMDLVEQQDGGSGSFILSKDNTPMKFSQSTELITQFLPFDPNRKTLINKVCTALEKQSVNESFFERTQTLMAEIERFLLDLSFDLPGELYFEKLNAGALIKASGIQLAEDTSDMLEQLLNYMDFVRELEGEKVFIFINMRSYFTSNEMSRFTDSVLRKKFMIFLMDNRAYTLLPQEQRCLIDEDLCEI